MSEETKKLTGANIAIQKKLGLNDGVMFQYQEFTEQLHKTAQQIITIDPINGLALFAIVLIDFIYPLKVTAPTMYAAMLAAVENYERVIGGNVGAPTPDVDP